LLFEIISTIRLVRADKNVPNSKPIDIEIGTNSHKTANFIKENTHYLKKFANYSQLLISTSELDTNKKIVNVLSSVVLAIPLAQLVDVEQERFKLVQNKDRLQSEIVRCQGMLKNSNFLNKAPLEKINAEKAKLVDYEKQLTETIKLLEEIDG
jgi:valyl-tRNA synthetase